MTFNDTTLSIIAGVVFAADFIAILYLYYNMKNR